MSMFSGVPAFTRGEGVPMKGLTLFTLVYVLATLAVARLMPLPIEPTLRLAALLVPVIVAMTVVAAWHEAGAPWPRLRWPWRGDVWQRVRRRPLASSAR
jgi:hypothetical protein